MKRCKLVSAAATAAMVGILGFSMPAFAASGYGNVEVKTDAGKSITIGNDAFARTFSFENGKLKTTLIDNKLGKSQFVPGEKSEEFLIEGMFESARQEPQSPLTSVKPGSGSTVSATAKASATHENECPKGAAGAIDGDTATYWATLDQGEATNPWLEVDFGREVTFASLKYTARNAGSQYGYQCTGQVETAYLEKWNGTDWVKVQDFTFETGKDKGPHTVTLDAPVTASKVRFVVTKGYHWNAANVTNKFANIAEIDFFDDQSNSVIHGTQQAAGAWEIETNSDKGTADGGGIQALIDGNLTTYWHCNYNNGQAVNMPATITIDRGEAQKDVAFQTVGYAGRKEGASSNGNFKKFAVYASNTKDGLFEQGNLKDTCTVSYTGAYGTGAQKMVYCGLDEAVTGRYVGIKVLEGNGGFAAGAELDLFKEQFSSVPETDAGTLKASNMTLAGDPVVTDTTVTIQGVEKTGKLVTFAFEPVSFGSGNATVELKAVMYNGDHFMRKWIELKSEDQDIRVKFIDGEHLATKEGDTTWTVPTDAGGIVAMDMARANLGQPIYVNGLFMGSEFPVADNQIVDGTGRARYWSGKNFADFARDGQLNTEGEYVSWQTVCGATRSDGSDMNVIQTDFYSYITSISKPSDFRIQYNSWFDNMMRINDENILESFKAVDKHLSETGVRPLESYVVDDGWNNYRQYATQHNDKDGVDRNGTAGTVNTSGFWAFNDKFPDGLTPSSSLVQKLGSNFGVWIGPRGGYNYYNTLADLIAAAGNGSKAGGSIDVADQRYVTKFQEMAVDWMEQYGVNYWKWDGFADNAQYNAFQMGENVAGYDAGHQHMYGGPSGMFHSTDLWEKWIVLFDEVWKTADAEQIEDLWISLTCYVNPSPWYLQWSNSVWIQCVGDRGEVHNGMLNDKMNTMLTYRDACYYDFINNHEFQFPLANLYNHDPIYGKEGTGITANSMDGAEFRNYLFMQGTRGTAFWELYYSDSLFDEEKYLVNADFLAWEEGNFDMLRNAKWVGGTPSSSTGLSSNPTITNPGTQEAYGFSGFNDAGDEGIISMRNPATTDKTIEFKLDAGVGCKVEGEYKVAIDHSFTEDGSANAEAPKTIAHGSTVSMTLKPGEVQIWHLSKDGDTTAPKPSDISFVNNTTVRVQTSEHVSNAAFEVTVNGKAVELAEGAVRAYADLKTFDITLSEALTDAAVVEVKATAGADSVGNKLAGTVSAAHYDGGQIASVDQVAAGTEVSAAKRSVSGDNGFTVTASVNGVANGSTVVSQGDQWSLKVNEEGYAVFEVLGVSATSEAPLSTGAQVITGVRENNGMVKIYVDGQISGSSYDEKTVGKDVKAAAITAGAAATNVVVYDNALGYDEVPASPLEELIETVEFLRDKVTAESWAAANTDAKLAAAKEALKGDDAAAKQTAYNELLAAYGQLVPGVDTSAAVNHALEKDVIARWKKDDASAENSADMPVSKAVDGVKNTSTQYGEFGHDDRAESSYLQVDLGAVQTVTSINMYRYYLDGRSYPNTTIVLSEDKTFDENDVIVYNSDADNKNGFGAGQDEAYNETAAGKTFAVADGTQARYVRVYMNGNVRPSHTGNTNHIVELEVMGPKKADLGDPFGIERLEALIEQAKTAVENEADYTVETMDALKAELKEAEDFAKQLKGEIASGNFTTSYGQFDAACNELQAAIDGLQAATPEPQPVEHTVTFDYGYEGAEPATVKVEDGKQVEKPADPVREGYVFKGWFDGEEAYDFAAAVKADLTLTAKWEKAVEPEPEVNKAALQAKYDEVKDLQADGYTVDTWKAFEAARDLAKRVLESDRAGQGDVDAALQMLEAAHAGLKKEEAPQVDKAALEAAVKEAKELKADDYKSASWKPFARALAEADKVLADEKADQAAVDAAAKALADAKAGLVEVEEISFIDVDGDTSHADDIAWLAANGIASGWENADGTFEFRPYATVRRADMAAFLYRLAGEPEFDAEGVSFADVDEETPHYKAILWLAAEGISTGWKLGDGTAEFHPYDEIARCDMAAFLYRMAGEPEFEDEVSFADVEKDTPHREAVLWLAASGVSEGWTAEDGIKTFRPYDEIVRCDMAAFLQRMAEKDLVDLK